MTDEYAPRAVELVIAGLLDDDVDGLTTAASETHELHVGTLREIPAPRDLFFDVGSTIDVVRSVTAVISGVGGAAKVIDWVLTKLRERRGGTIVLKAGTTTVTVKTGDDPERARQLLEAALHAV